MRGNSLVRAVAFALVVGLAGAASAQDRGRTDGPEGSEYGKGGYSAVHDNRFSLRLDWGASFLSDAPLNGVASGPPLFVGVTASWWANDWFVFDVSPAYLFDTQRVNLLVGPRFRTATYPVSGSLGLQAGPIFLPDGGVRFGVSPQAAVDMLLADHVDLGLQYAADIPLGDGALEHRVFMTVGYRF